MAGYLLILSPLYLALPHLIFFFGWLRWPFAVLAAVSVCVALGAVLRFVARLITPAQVASVPVDAPVNNLSDSELPVPADAAGESEAFVFTRQHALLIGAVCLMWLTISGVGGFIYQDQDWDKHNMVLNSLILKPWPTVYEIYQVDIPLVYYIGYYLPAALVGKVGGWFGANVALFLWSYVGLVLSALWFCILVRRASASVMLILVFFSGLDVLGKEMLNVGRMWNAGNVTWLHIEPWARLWQYSSNSTLLFWVPNQALAGWIVTGMLLYCLVVLRRRDLVLLPVGLSAFWSPFVTLGLIPFLVFDFLVDNEPLLPRLRRLLTIPNFVGLITLAITGFYFSAKLVKASPVIVQDLFNGFSLSQYEGTMVGAIAFLLFFCLVEFGLYAILLYRSGAIQDERWRWMLDIAVLTLLILPWFKLGVYNDLVMRASIPALFTLAVIVARAVHDETLMRQTRIALTVMLVVGALTSATEMVRHARWMSSQAAPLFDDTATPKDMVTYFKSETFFFGQYSGSLDTPFFQYAAKPLALEIEAVTGSNVAGSHEVELNAHDYVLFEDQVYLLRDSVKLPAEVMAGATFTVPWQLHFFAPGIWQNFDPIVRLVDEGGDAVWETHEWQTGRPDVEPFEMTHWSGMITASVPVRATPGIYSLELSFLGSRDDKLFTATSVPDGEPVGEVVGLGRLEVKRE